MASSEPFLEIITRVFRRPAMLARNQASLEAQTDHDWRQTLLIDQVGRGINWSHENLGRYAPHLVGQYIWLLDDDDKCIRPTLVAELKEIAGKHQPDVIMVRMDHGPRGVLPDPDYWERPPAHGHVGVSAYVVKRSVWQAHAAAWSPGVYHSDFNFIASVFEGGPRVYWHRVVASRVQQISLGRPEKEIGMKVRVIKSFVGYDGQGVKHRLTEGDELDLPAGVDWLKAGLVEALPPAPSQREGESKPKRSTRAKKKAD